MTTARIIQNDLLKLITRLTEESVELDPEARKVLYENLLNLYDSREEKIKDEFLTLEEIFDKIIAAEMTPFVVCTSCGRSAHHYFGTYEALQREMKKTCRKCMCIGRKKLLGDPQIELEL